VTDGRRNSLTTPNEVIACASQLVDPCADRGSGPPAGLLHMIPHEELEALKHVTISPDSWSYYLKPRFPDGAPASLNTLRAWILVPL
jgi:hypothetical protein